MAGRMLEKSETAAGPRLTAASRAIAAADIERPLSWAFIALVVLCLVLPLVQTLYPVFGTIARPLEERRVTTPFPSLHLLASTDGEFAAGLNKWFDDRVGFRDLFIRTKNQIDYTLFGTSKKVYVGSDGWLFGRPGHAVSKLDAAGLSALEESYLTLARRLRERGVQLIVVGYPDKAAIYPEKAPPQMPLMAAGGNYDQFKRFLASRSELTFIDAEETMKREAFNTPERLYYKTDMHVTYTAEIPIVSEIVARIAQAEGRPEIRWDENFTVAPLQWPPGRGSEARFMSLLFPLREGGISLTGTYAIGGQEPDGHWYLPDPHIFERADSGIGRPFDWEFRSLPELCASRLPGMVLFGNSFSDPYWELGLHRYFCFIRRARNPIGRFTTFFETMPPGTKYFIFQYYEPWLTEVLGDPWFSPPPSSK
jgi:hypothetical protein